MPELPEVESLRLALAPCLVGRTVLRVDLHRRDILVAPGDPRGGFSRQRGPKRRRPARLDPADLLRGLSISRLDRRGKQLAIISAVPTERALVVQLGMSGQLLLSEPGARTGQHDHVHASWVLDDGSRLLFRDPRRFGGLRAFSSLDDLHSHWAALGPDALSVLPEQLAAAVAGSRRPIKSALLDQAAIAGVGNIYADEALFAAGVRPTRLASRLGAAEIARLASTIRHTLSCAVEAGGSTLRDFLAPDGQPGSYQNSHSVYGRAGLPCVTCATRLRSATVAQRTTVWCPHCQS